MAISRPLRVLLVEDDDDQREPAAALLRRAGYIVETATNGKLGADWIVEHLPDVAVVDIGLPVMTGLEVASFVRACRGRSVYLIAVTGNDRDTVADLSRLAGFDGYLAKPYTLEQLEAHFVSAVARARAQL